MTTTRKALALVVLAIGVLGSVRAAAQVKPADASPHAGLSQRLKDAGLGRSANASDGSVSVPARALSEAEVIEYYRDSINHYRELWLSAAVLVFGFIVVSLQTWLVLAMKQQWRPLSILRVYGLTLVVVIAAFLLTAGYSDEQLVPIVGLLGSIAGYLLGKTDRSEDGPGEVSPPQAPPPDAVARNNLRQPSATQP